MKNHLALERLMLCSLVWVGKGQKLVFLLRLSHLLDPEIERLQLIQSLEPHLLLEVADRLFLESECLQVESLLVVNLSEVVVGAADPDPVLSFLKEDQRFQLVKLGLVPVAPQRIVSGDFDEFLDRPNGKHDFPHL